MARNPKKGPNTGFRNNQMFCFNCGTAQALPVPMSVNDMVDLTRKFDKEHKSCAPTWKQPVNENAARMTELENILWWLGNGEQGQSSKTMTHLLADASLKGLINFPNPMAAPVDPDDFKRCEWLLQAVPVFRERLDQMKQAGPVWSNLVENWDMLSEMLEEQLQGKQNGMYELMMSLGC